MSHFARVQNGIVTSVIVIEKEVLDLGHWGDPAEYYQTSYNTQGGKHLLGGTPLRGNYAGVGFIYDSANDVFYPPAPFPSWVLNNVTWTWEPPTPMPVVEGKMFVWDEPTTSWVEFVPPVVEAPVEAPVETPVETPAAE